MRFVDRLEFLNMNATRELSLGRKLQLAESLEDWVNSEECEAKTPEELLWMLTNLLKERMGIYELEVQAQIGGEIIKRAFQK